MHDQAKWSGLADSTPLPGQMPLHRPMPACPDVHRRYSVHLNANLRTAPGVAMFSPAFVTSDGKHWNKYHATMTQNGRESAAERGDAMLPAASPAQYHPPRLL